MSDFCLKQDEQFYSYIMPRTSYENSNNRDGLVQSKASSSSHQKKLVLGMI
jgi:hypothetical protein